MLKPLLWCVVVTLCQIAGLKLPASKWVILSVKPETDAATMSCHLLTNGSWACIDDSNLRVDPDDSY